MIKTAVWKAMGTEIELSVPGAYASLIAATQNLFTKCERICSRFIADSELMRINNSHTTWQPVSPTLWSILFLADRAYHQTHGLFSPYLLDTIKYHGYDRSYTWLHPPVFDRDHDFLPKSSRDTLRKVVQDPTEKRLVDVLQHVSDGAHLNHITNENPDIKHKTIDFIDDTNGKPGYKDDSPLQFSLRPLAIKKRADISIDLGGIAKGWATQRIAHFLKIKGVPYGSLNAGGDLIVWNDSDDEPWLVEIEDPRIYLEPKTQSQSPPPLVTFPIRQGAVATSGTLKRRWIHHHTLKHHLIDPRTNRPSASDVLQSTVLSSNLIEAEVLAKIPVILGQKAGEDFLGNYARRTSRRLRWWLVTKEAVPAGMTPSP